MAFHYFYQCAHIVDKNNGHCQFVASIDGSGVRGRGRQASPLEQVLVSNRKWLVTGIAAAVRGPPFSPFTLIALYYCIIFTELLRK
jgi:hypothetical protein